MGVAGTGSETRRPSASSAATASREISVTPRPTLADSRIAPLEPTIRVSGVMSSSVSSASVAARVPEPGSRSSHAWPASHGTRWLASGLAGSVPGSAASGAGSGRGPGSAHAARPGAATTTSWWARTASTSTFCDSRATGSPSG